MAETDEKIPDNVRVVTFQDRELWALEPNEGQVLAMQRLGNLPAVAETSAARMLAALNRVPNLVESLLARDADKDWFEDGYITGKVKVEQLPDLCADIIKAWWLTDANRATRRRAAKKTTATRAR